MGEVNPVNKYKNLHDSNYNYLHYFKITLSITSLGIPLLVLLKHNIIKKSSYTFNTSYITIQLYTTLKKYSKIYQILVTKTQFTTTILLRRANAVQVNLKKITARATIQLMNT